LSGTFSSNQEKNSNSIRFIDRTAPIRYHLHGRIAKGAERMRVALSDLKVNVGKYVDLAETEDVIITKYGKPAAKMIRYDKEPWYMKKLPAALPPTPQQTSFASTAKRAT